MVLVHLQDVRFDVRDRILFHIKDLSIHQGERIGLVGRNGSGKTSLLQVIAKEKEPAAGTVTQRGTAALLPQLKPRKGKKSGGEISQAVIHETLSQDAHVLLADEPTTHLDMENVEKLEQQLKRRQESMVVVSHDRAFLDALCNQIWELEDERIRVYSGNYTDYEQQKEAARKHHEKEYEKYIHKKKQLKEAVQQKDQKAQRAVKKPKNISSSEARGAKGAKPYFAKKQKKLNQGVKSIQTRLEQLDKVEKVKELPPIKMAVAHEESLKKRTIIRGEQITGAAGGRLLWKAFDFSVSGGDKVALIGPNGSGKTTFLRMILDGAEGIHISPSVSFGYFSQMLEVLNVDDSIVDNVSSTSSQHQTLIRTVLARLGFFRDDVFKPVHVLSGGERVKVAFAKLFVSNANVLILDEPTNYLDIEAVEELGSLLHDYSGTVMLVSHDRRLLEHVATKVFAIRNKRIHSFEGSYLDYTKTEPQKDHDPLEDQLLKIETKITDVLSRLSIEPSEKLEEEFQQLLHEKKEINQRLE
ncbi:ribosomal protection-like ABC-F family protein [Halobacillus naozhouensis]|uniref:ABC-F type ribosomal protection protein n=1 Tax=Halobacillus naozhouensis TaxID=554880 RepID=A0ABY8J2V3_9BACI|nr:ABC-F type ribosomal protection protein [Halobacillus naozhouensis]WFT76402.1 ABC-F type ribosomal protection protein [Halobacillus naozhouensis]